MAHTPGDWKVLGATMVYADTGFVAVMLEPSTRYSHQTKPVEIDSERFAEAVDNARLIAAAPDLLRCLRGALLVVQKGPMKGVFLLRVTTEELHAMHAAIAKAEGRA
jgi:hypothetical protein